MKHHPNEAYYQRCVNCAALVAGNGDKWICDELEKEVTRIESCPEKLSFDNDE